MVKRAEKLLEIVREVNSWDGSLENLNFYYNESDNLEMFFEGRLEEFARSVTFGKYHYMDEYFRFNGYGNIESMSERGVEETLIDWEEDILVQAKHIAESNGHMSYLMEELESYKENFGDN